MVKEETGFSLDEWLDSFQGEIAVGFDPDHCGLHANRPYWVLLADIGDNAAKVRRLMRINPRPPKPEVNPPAGFPVHEETRAFEGVGIR